MITKKVKALKDMNFSNIFGSIMLTKDEIITIQFKNESDFVAHVKLGNFDPVGEGTAERIVIPVIQTQPNIENPYLEQLEITGNLDKLKPITKADTIAVEPKVQELPKEETISSNNVSNMEAYEAALKEVEGNLESKE